MDAVTSVTSLPGYLDATETASSVPVITATGFANSDPNVDMSVFGKLPIYYSEAPASANLGSSMAAPEVQERPLNWKPLYLGLATMAVLLLFRTAR